LAISQQRHRTRYVVAVLVLASLTLVTLSARGRGNPTLRAARNDLHGALTSVQSTIHDVLRPVGNFLTGAVQYGSLKADNARLRQQLATAQTAASRARFDQAMADQVLKLAGIPFAAGIPTVAAQVVAQPASNFESTITIDKGTSSGIAVDQPVVTAAGLVGQITSATRGSAVVTLLTDPDFYVGVTLPATSSASADVGSADGRGTRDLYLDPVQTTGAAVPVPKKGQMLFTTATGGSYPAGIPVGRVATVSRQPGQETPAITLAPAADTSDLGVVAVMLWSGQ
jgi:rod shape-determining protein MreC